MNVYDNVEKIINLYSLKYPEYQFELLPGYFPIIPSCDLNSTHVLYITNYKEILEEKTK